MPSARAATDTQDGEPIRHTFDFVCTPLVTAIAAGQRRAISSLGDHLSKSVLFYPIRPVSEQIQGVNGAQGRVYLITCLQDPVQIATADTAEAALDAGLGGKRLECRRRLAERDAPWLLPLPPVVSLSLSGNQPLERGAGDTEVYVEEGPRLSAALGALTGAGLGGLSAHVGGDRLETSRGRGTHVLQEIVVLREVNTITDCTAETPTGNGLGLGEVWTRGHFGTVVIWFPARSNFALENGANLLLFVCPRYHDQLIFNCGLTVRTKHLPRPVDDYYGMSRAPFD